MAPAEGKAILPGAPTVGILAAPINTARLMHIPGFWPTLPILALLVPMSSGADAFDPLPTYNQNPFALIYGLPSPDAPRLIGRGELHARVTLESASHFYSAGDASEQLVIDGETHRTAVTIKYGSGTAEWGIEVPYLSHSGGFMDSFIDGWHDFFGLPDGGRAAAVRDELRYVYARDGTDRLRLTQAARGVGDARLLAAWPVAGGNTDMAVRASLKLPTGDAAELRGSGAADFALWVASGCAAARCGGAWRWNANAGALALGRGDVLPDQQRRLAAFGGIGGGWRAWRAIVLKAELRAHTPFYDGTQLAPLGTSALQLILGGSFDLPADTVIDVAVSEDIRVNTAPDVSFLFSVRARF